MSEIKQINTGVAELLAVKVPDGACKFDVLNSLNKPQIRTINPKHGGWWYSNDLPLGNWTPLGMSTEIEEDVLFDLMPGYVDFYGSLFFGTEELHFDTPEEAFASLMQANGINEPHLIIKRLS